MAPSVLLLGISWPAVVFGFVIPVAIFVSIILLFKLAVHIFRSIRDRRYERAYEARKAEKAAREKGEKNGE